MISPKRPLKSPAKRRAVTAWKQVTRLDVYYQDDATPEPVGGLVVDRQGRVHFQYAATWLETKRELSPHQLPLEQGLAVIPASDRRKLHGLHGVFADSLPDHWGMRVIDRALRRHGIDPGQAGPLDRLAYLGSRTMGALTYRPAARWPHIAARATSLDQLAAESDLLTEGTIDDTGPEAALDALEQAASSAGGAQPKVLIATDSRGTRLTAGIAPRRGGIAYLLKFTPRRSGLGLRTDNGAIEQAFGRMARDAGITMPWTRLFPTSDGRLHFAVERFDRTRDGGRRHVLTFGGLLGREAAGDGDYDELLRYARALTADARAVDEVIRRLCFNLAVLNDDDHLKNVAFLLDPVSGWQLAPAYDLTYSPTRRGERGMTVDGRDREVTWDDVERLAARHSIAPARVREIRAVIYDGLKRWAEYAEESGVPGAAITELAGAFESRRHALDN